MSLTLKCKLDSDKERIIYTTCSKLLNVYNKSTNQNLSFEFNQGYVIIDKSLNTDLLNLFGYFSLHLIDLLDNRKDDIILSNYILDMLKSRLDEVKYFSKDDIHDRNYVNTLYNLLSNFNFSFLSKDEIIIEANQKLNNFKNEFEYLYKSWL